MENQIGVGSKNISAWRIFRFCSRFSIDNAHFVGVVSIRVSRVIVVGCEPVFNLNSVC